MPFLKDHLLSFAFSHVYFLTKSSSHNIANLVTCLSCCFQLWCHVWSILSLIIDDPGSVVTKSKTYISGVFMLVVLSSCVLNIVITIQLTFSRSAAKYTTTLVNLHSKRKTFLETVVFLWILIDVYKTCHTSYHYLKQGRAISSILILFSFNYLILRIQVAVLYVGLKIENIALRFEVLNRELSLWLPLYRVIKINQQHHKLVNEIQEISRVVGPTTFLFCLRSIGVMLINFYSLIFLQPDEMIIKVLVWFRIKHILMHFVRVNVSHEIMY